MLYDPLDTIEILPDLSSESFLLYCQRWDNQDGIYIDMSAIFNIDDIIHCAQLALSMYHYPFSLAVLSEIAEMDNVPDYILKSILLTGDQSCLESVCLRKNLGHELRTICRSCDLIHNESGMHK